MSNPLQSITALLLDCLIVSVLPELLMLAFPATTAPPVGLAKADGKTATALNSAVNRTPKLSADRRLRTGLVCSVDMAFLETIGDGHKVARASAIARYRVVNPMGQGKGETRVGRNPPIADQA